MKVIVSIFLALFVLGCSDKTTEEAQTQEVVKQEAVKPVIEKEVVKVAPVAIVEKKVQEVVAVVASVDGKALYAKCTGCHGANGEKKALGKSAVIGGWDVAKTESALNGYKDGSYGGAMKAMMKGQVSSLSSEEITALSKYIANL